MTNSNPKPIIFLAFANEPPGAQSHLRNLGEEARRLSETLQQAEKNGLCQLVVEAYATLDTILKTFQQHRNRIAIFHYGGHAHNYQLLLESAKGTVSADAGGLAAFLGQQTGLQLIFLNGCSTQPQVQALLATNVSGVIATSQAIKDDIATNFAGHFYQSLSSGVNLHTAYNEAEAAVRSAVSSSNTRDAYVEGEEMLADRWPWDLYVKEGAEIVKQWSLPEAANNPLFGLSPLPELDLPDGPFRHLHWFEQEHAEIFFGRGYQIRKLYEQVAEPRTPIILLYGQSGVGKSSLLAAGLLPRLEANYETRYIRRDRDKGVLGTLRMALNVEGQDISLVEAWRKSSTKEHPIIVILDQLEEVYTRPTESQPDELETLLTELQSLFVNSSQRPPGKLILSFRKEWLADIENRLGEHNLPRAKVFLERLDRNGIVEAIVGPTRSKRLQDHYNLTVEDELPGIIADDLLDDRDSPIAPTLQILLTKMWERAKAENYDRPQFDLELYQSLKREGVLLKDFLAQQLAALAGWREDVITSGLALDLLAFHTTPQGTAEQRSQARLLETYAHRQDVIKPIVQQCEDLYLLVDPSKNQPGQPKASRLAHDALAPLVRHQFDESDAPGQRARRILESRVLDWRNDREGNPFDEADLIVVERGLAGMRTLDSDAKRLVEASRAQHSNSLRLRLTQAAIMWTEKGRIADLLWPDNSDLLRLSELTKIEGQWFDKLETEFLQQSIKVRHHTLPDLTDENNPYRDFLPYEQEHKDLFFGRSDLIKRLVQHVETHPWTIVIGSSGSGKSSLVKAGLLPAISDSNWHIFPIMHPSELQIETFRGLITTCLFGKSDPRDADLLEMIETWRSQQHFLPTRGPNIEESEEYALIAAWLERHSGKGLLLIIDQFEEIDANNNVISLVETLSSSLRYGKQLRVVITLNIYFEGQVKNSWSKKDRFELEPMSSAELREVIEGPAQKYGLYFDPSELVDQLVEQFVRTPSLLPILSHILAEMYLDAVKRQSRALIKKDQGTTQAIEDYLLESANQIYNKLDKSHQTTMRRIILRMISLEGGNQTKRRVLKSEFVYSDGGENRKVESILRQLIDARILIGGESSGEPYIEPTDNILIQRWSRLNLWREEETNEIILLQRRVTDAANYWNGTGEYSKDDNYLWHNSSFLPLVERELGQAYHLQRKIFQRTRDHFFTNKFQILKENWLNDLEQNFILRSMMRQRRNRRISFYTVGIVVTLLVLTSVVNL